MTTRRPLIVRWFAMAVGLALPTEFRRQFGQALIDAFEDQYRGSDGGSRVLSVCREFALLLVAAVRIRLDAPRRTRRSNLSPVTRWRQDLVRDARHASRGLRRQPIFTLSAIVTLGLGIGINTAIFSVIEAVLLRPPPFPGADHIVYVFESAPSFERGVASPANYRAWEARDDVFAAIAAVSGGQFHIDGNGAAEELNGRFVSPAFFRVMGVAPVVGRTLVDGDDHPDEPVAVIGFGLWQRRFNADSSVVGSSLVLDGVAHRIVGVMPSSFDFPSGAEIWAPLTISAENWERRTWYYLQVVARLRQDVTLSVAQTAMNTLAAQRAQLFPDTNGDRGINIERFHDVEVSRVRSDLWMLFGAVGFVLLIACANVANLLLTRSVTRKREISIRTALGASRGQIGRLLLVESVGLGLVGGAIGVALAALGVSLFGALAPSWFPRVEDVTIDSQVLGYTFGIAIVTSILSGLAPTRRLTRVPVADSLRASPDGKVASGLTLRQGLVVVETALALVLLVGAGLLVRSFHRLTTQPLGFDPTNLLTADVSLPRHAFTEAARRREFFSTLLEQVRALPGVTMAGATHSLPFGDGWYGMDMTLVRGDGLSEPERISATIHNVSPDYFITMGLPVNVGRPITESDRSGEPLVVVVNSAFVRQFLKDGNPLQAELRFLNSERPIAIVGVSQDAKHVGLDDRVAPSVYFSAAQRPSSTMSVVARTTTNPIAIAPAIERTVRALDSSVPVVRIATMDDLITGSLAQPRFYTVLLIIFAGTAVTLAGVGIYGLLSYLVAQREREIGIRMALGARSTSVIRLIVGRGLVLAGFGVTVGLAAAYALTRVLESLLFEITATDPTTFGVVTAFFLALAIAASYGPARRSTRMNPIETLRAE